jgi:3-hydroxymyristoyl/3-hydroxydecanoyl-(acyl carrier protein) dehydratase
VASGKENAIERLVFEVLVPADHPCLPGHFPGNPIVPGVLLLDAIVAHLEQATGRRAIRLQQVKFLSVLRPDEQALAQCEVEGDTATFRAFTRWGSAMVPLASGTLSLRADAAGTMG